VDRGSLIRPRVVKHASLNRVEFRATSSPITAAKL
jgi:hypothetical protein